MEHITTIDEAAHIMHETNTKFYAQRNHQGKTLAAYEADEDGFVNDVTEREKIKEEIAEQERILKHLMRQRLKEAD